MKKSIVPVKHVYTYKNIVYQRLETNEDDAKKSKIWYPINFYWKPILELREEMHNGSYYTCFY